MVNFPFGRLIRLSQIERVHFWFIGRRQLIDRALRKYSADKVRLILEVGWDRPHG